MHNILVINAGSSSLKYQLMNMDSSQVLANGIAERIGSEGSKLTFKANGTKTETVSEMKDHSQAIALVMEVLINEKNGVLKSVDDIFAIGHRVVHGGEAFSESAIINSKTLAAIQEYCVLAPLHNPANIMGIQACEKMMPGKPNVAVFDTAFHQTMPPKAFMYGLPYSDYTELKVRRYGFHGTSHNYVSKKMAEILGKNIEDLKIVTCHIGNGSSVAAVNCGKVVDTSMGLTPLEGVVMGTRCGSIDPAIVTYLAGKKNFTFEQMDAYLNKQSGVLGLSGVGSDFRDLNDAADAGNERARLALEVVGYSIKKYVGAYTAAMNGIDALVFTAGVGENDHVIRECVASDMEFFGIDFDKDVNNNAPRGQAVELTKPNSKVKAWIVPTDEEFVIANDTFELTKNL